MTTNIKAAYADDLSVINEVLNFNEPEKFNLDHLAGANWLVTGFPPIDSMNMVLKFIYGLVFHKFSGISFWLLIGTSTWQQDTRIVRHRGIWGLLKARGIEISHTNDATEVMVEENGKAKFFGAIRFSELSLPSVARTLLEERCCYLIASCDGTVIPDLLNVGWTGDISNDSEFLQHIGRAECLCLKGLGGFDDAERGMLALGKVDLMKKLRN